MTFPYEQSYLDDKKKVEDGSAFVGATGDIPTNVGDTYYKGSLLVDTTTKKTYIITAVAADGAITKQQIGAWT